MRSRSDEHCPIQKQDGGSGIGRGGLSPVSVVSHYKGSYFFPLTLLN